ncbi:hypothetical protein QQ045_029777 [Rhodiola kirilowii]
MTKLVGYDEDIECANCKVRVKEKEEDRVIEFLVVFNEEYAHLRTHILAMRKLPSFDVVYDMVLNDESQQKVTRHSLVEASALYSNQQESHGFEKGQMRMFRESLG